MKWHIERTGRPSNAKPDEPGFTLLKQSHIEAQGVTARETSDYLYQYADVEEDCVCLELPSGAVVFWASVSDYLKDDTEAEKYGYTPSSEDVDADTRKQLEEWW